RRCATGAATPDGRRSAAGRRGDTRRSRAVGAAQSRPQRAAAPRRRRPRAAGRPAPRLRPRRRPPPRRRKGRASRASGARAACGRGAAGRCRARRSARPPFEPGGMEVDLRKPLRLAPGPARGRERNAAVVRVVAWAFEQHPAERPLAPRPLEHGHQLRVAVVVEVRRRHRVVDDHQRVFAPLLEHRREQVDVVAPQPLDLAFARDRDGAPESLDPLVLVRPHERLEEPRAVLVERNRVEVEPDPAADLESAPEQFDGRAAAIVALEHEDVRAAPPRPRAVAVVVAVEREQEPRAGAELDEIDPWSVERQEPGQQPPGAPDLVRLHRLLADEALEQLALVGQRGIDVVPARPAAEHEVVQPAEQAQRQVPAKVGRKLADPPVDGEAPAELRIERRAAIAELRLPVEDRGLAVYFACASAAFACSASSPNFAGSLTARSARILRSSSTSAAFSPATNWLYESPFARAPALMRMIQRRRNSRFRTLRSRYAYASERSTCSFAYLYF